jgi:Ca2+-binding RTX toxin-like protein
MSGGNGNDTFVGGAGNDTFAGGNGADVFVFTSADGLDTINGFQRGQDRVDLTATDLLWDDLDSNGNGVLDNADDFVNVSGGDTVIDLGAATGGLVGLNTLTFDGVTNVAERDFLFGGG